MPPALHLSGPCEVCGQPAHGRHFGVFSCRACAAFFRRAARKSAKSQDIICPKGNCIIFDHGEYRCKMCRLKQCLEVGMDCSKFHDNHDLISNVINYSKRSVPQSLSNFLGRPEMILSCEPDKMSRVKTIIDMTWLIEKAVKVFQKEPTTLIPYQVNNSLERMSLALANQQKEETNQKLEVWKVFGKKEILYTFEQMFLGATQWLAELPEFRELDMAIKTEILKSCWMLWNRLNFLAESAEYHRNKVLGGTMFMVTEGACINVQQLNADVSWCTNYSMEQVGALLMPDATKRWIEPVSELLKLNPTDVELNFMLLQLCLHDAGKKFQGKILETTDEIIRIHADNLHEYYTKTQKMYNYSGRLTRLLRINKDIETDVRHQREKQRIAELFNVLSLQYSHPEMFEFT
ncbi:hypothetical protein GCK72_019997 [Caenorhabditis remanei]|uniref:Uncharacterized protein n=1 Tax=Caenorhabditis remanei TaxID=31234 RepID=A0A6A5GEB8_CAERE|nr:hypothetical protein GCK72_019997 [Caenorhabditis remanei]KAF1753440.1 hypothetical protein GCK72_019997 [Caenorhabditis remanei]